MKLKPLKGTGRPLTKIYLAGWIRLYLFVIQHRMTDEKTIAPKDIWEGIKLLLKREYVHVLSWEGYFFMPEIFIEPQNLILETSSVNAHPEELCSEYKLKIMYQPQLGFILDTWVSRLAFYYLKTSDANNLASVKIIRFVFI